MAIKVYPDTVFNPRCVLGVDAWGHYRVLVIDTSGHLQVDVLSSALPSGGATAANQATLIAKAQNQLISYKEPLAVKVTHTADAGDVATGYMYACSGSPSAGDIWHVTTVSAWENLAAGSYLYLTYYDNSAVHNIFWQEPSPTRYVTYCVPCDMWLEGDDQICARVSGPALGEKVEVIVFGHKMTKQA